MKAKHAITIAGVILITAFPYITLPVAVLTGLAVFCCSQKRCIRKDGDELSDQVECNEVYQDYAKSLTSISPDGSKLFVFEPNTPSPTKAVIIASIINGTVGCNLLLLSQTIGDSILSCILPATSCAVSCVVLSRIIKAHLEEGTHKFRIIGSYNLSDQVAGSDVHDTNEILLGGELNELHDASD